MTLLPTNEKFYFFKRKESARRCEENVNYFQNELGNTAFNGEGGTWVMQGASGGRLLLRDGTDKLASGEWSGHANFPFLFQ